MATAFSRTLRTLSADSFRYSIGALALAAALLVVWLAWFTLARITLYEVTDQARLETSNSAFAVESPIAARVMSSRLAIGREVMAGEILVELDSSPEQMQIQEESTRLKGLVSQVTALRAQAQSEEVARVEEQRAAQVSVEQARAQEKEALLPYKYNEDEAQRLAKLHKEGLIAERDYAKGRADADRQKAVLETSRISAGKIEQEQRTKDRERDTRIRRLNSEIAALEGQIATIHATEARLRNEVERRVVRAPASGRLGDVKILHSGAYLNEGDRIASIVPSGSLSIVAQFPPPSAIGRLRPGQHARLRLQGFPWIQYGALEATVTNVGDEIRDGSIRVELAVNNTSTLRLKPQHGMPGSLEVEVEQLSPASLLLRLAGQWLTQTHATAGATPKQ